MYNIKISIILSFVKIYSSIHVNRYICYKKSGAYTLIIIKTKVINQQVSTKSTTAAKLIIVTIFKVLFVALNLVQI